MACTTTPFRSSFLWPEVNLSLAFERLLLTYMSLNFLDSTLGVERGWGVRARVCHRWLLQTPLLFPISGCMCKLYACLIFTRGSIPFNFIFTPKARVLREHGVLTLPRLSAAERRLYIVTYSFLSIFLHLLPGNIAASGHGAVLVPTKSSLGIVQTAEPLPLAGI